MADRTDANALILNISADNRRALNAIDQIAARLDAAGIDLPKKAKKAVAGVEQAFGGLSRVQGMELAHSLRASFDALAAGASPVRILAMEAPRLAQALGSGPNGVAGSLAALGRFINPVTVGLAAVAGVAVAGVIAGKQHVDVTNAMQNAIAGLGRASGVTVGQMQDVAQAQAAAGGITETAAEKIETALLKTGSVAADSLGEATTVVREFARSTHSSLDDATKLLGKAFEDPAKGAHDLGEEYGLLDEKQVKVIQDTQEHAGKAAALKVLLADLDGELKRSAGSLASNAAGWDAVAQAVGRFWDALGKVVAGDLGLAPLAEQLKTLQKLRQQYAASGDAGLAGQLPQLDAQIAALQKQTDASDALTRATATRAAANEKSIQIADKKAKADEAARAAARATQQAAEHQLAQQELALRAEIDQANSAGDVAEAQRLQDKLSLLGREKAYMQAGLTQTQAQIAAERDLGVIQKARAAAQAAGLDALEREAQLRVAQTSGNQVGVDQLQREVQLEKLTAEYQKDGLDYELAHAYAMRDLNAEQDALNEKRARAVADMYDEAALQAAQLLGDQQTVDLIEHRLDQEKLIQSYMDQHMTKAEAEKAAAEDLLKIDAARAAQKEQLLGQMQQVYALTLAEAKGDEAAIQALQQAAKIAEMVKSLMAAMPGLDEASATDIATQAQSALVKAAHTAANDFETLNSALGGISSAFESHDWGSLTNSLAAAMNALKSSFGPGGTLAGKIGAVAGVGNMIGGAVGGQAGSTISGLAGGAMIGMTLGGPIGAALGAIGGGIAGFLGGGNGHARDDAARQAAEQAYQQQAQATTAALEKLQQQQGDYASALGAFYTASGQSQKALDQQRADELKGLDDATAAIKKQTYAWDDYNSALQTANDNITSAQDALKQAYQTDAAALQATIDAVDTAKADLVAAYQAEASALGDVITRFQQFKATLTAFRASLDMGDLGAGGPGGQYRAAASAFQTTLAGALTGDDSAMGGFTQAAQNFLTASKANAASQVDYLRDVAKVKSATDRVGAMSDDQVSIAQKQLDVMTQQVGQLVDLNDKTQTVATATAALKAAQDQAITASQQLETERAQVSGLVNINDSVLTVAQAIANLQAALLAQASLSPPPATPPAGGPPGGTYTSTNGDYAAYVMGNPDLLAGFNNPTTGFANPVFKQTLIAAGLPATMAGFGQFQWEHAGALENRPVRPFAKGGSFALPGLAGIDRNLLSLNGHPIARVSAGEQMTITPKALGLDEPGSGGDDLQLVRFGIEQLAVRMGSMDARQQRWDKLGVPVRGVDPNQPLTVRVA